MKEIVGENALQDFFTSIGVQPNIAKSALKGLQTEGTASVLNVILPEEMLINLGLADRKEQHFVSVRFTVFHEPTGPVLAYCLAGPFMSANFSSEAGVRYADSTSLLKTLDSAGLPGRKIVSESQLGETYTVSTAQLAQLGFSTPGLAPRRDHGIVDRPGVKPSRPDLERLGLVELAVLCQKVTDNSSVSTEIAELAWKLKREWVLLVTRETPPPPNPIENDRIQKEKAELKVRMVDFLAVNARF